MGKDLPARLGTPGRKATFEVRVACVRSTMAKRTGIEFSEPLYCSEEQVAAAVLGPGHLQEWRERVPMLQRDGLPLVDELMGGRYLPAVRRYFDQRNGVATAGAVPQRADGKENFKCRTPKTRNLTLPVSSGEPERTATLFRIGPPQPEQ
jgi:hypothetical protein